MHGAGRLKPGPLSEVLNTTILWHAVSRIWTKAQPKPWLSQMKLQNTVKYPQAIVTFTFEYSTD